MIKLHRYESVIFTILTILISGASFLAETDIFRVLILIGLLIFTSLKRKKIIDKNICFIFCFWFIINLIAGLYLNQNINVRGFVGYLVYIFIPYLGMKCIGHSFWEKYEHFLYNLVIISFPIYLLSNIFPSLFDSISAIFKPITNSFFFQKETQSHYFYSFFFVYLGNNVFRNPGFMWEPGAYAMILIILISYNICKKGLVFTKRILIYAIALFSTFSTAGFIAFFFLMILFILQSKNIKYKIIFFISVIFLLSWALTADFLIPKINSFIETASSGDVSHQGYREKYEANRLLSFKLLLDKSLILPTGWGAANDTQSYLFQNNILTVNGLGNLLVYWGWIGLFLIVLSIYKFYYKISKKHIVSFVCIIALLSLFFSNPIEKNIITFLIVLSPYLQKQDYKNENWNHM